MQPPRKTPVGKLEHAAPVGRSGDWKWLHGVYAMQLSVRGNQNQGFNRAREMPTIVKKKEPRYKNNLQAAPRIPTLLL